MTEVNLGEVERWSQRLSALQRTVLTSERVSRETAEELAAAIEELHVAITELRHQNEELLVSREKLEAQRTRYADLFELAPDGYLETDLHGIILEANRAAGAMLGIEPAVLTSKPLVVFLAETERREFTLQLGLIEEGEEVRDWHLVLHPRNGPPMPVSVTARRAFDPSRETQKFRWSIRDASDRDRLERELIAARDRFTQMVEAMPAAVLTVDNQWRITYMNAAAEQLIVRTRESLIGRGLWEVFPDAGQSEFGEIGPRVMSSRRVERFQVQMPDGVWIEGSAFPVEDGIQAVFQDVTERKRAEEKRREIEEARSRFISRAAHELRSPLTAITGFVQTLAHRRHEMQEQEIDTSFDWLRLACERIDQLISDLLDLSQLEDEQFSVRVTRVDLTAAIDRVMQIAMPPEGKQIHRDLEPVAVKADALWLEQTIVNLLGNAYKYGGTEIRIVSRDKESHVELSIEDDGPGVPSAFVPDLFDSFTRGPNRGSTPGAGLGLAIVRRSLESFGARIHYEAAEPHGARFVIRLARAE